MLIDRYGQMNLFESIVPTSTIQMDRELQQIDKVLDDDTLFQCVKSDLARRHPQTPFLGKIDLVAFNFAPAGWLDCSGQLPAIASYPDLYSVIGTTYGGNGTTTFALPDLRDRVPIGTGQGPGLSLYALGQQGGESAHTLTIAEMPSHTHVVAADTASGAFVGPAGNLQAKNPAGIPNYGASADTTMSSSAIGLTGGGLPHNNLQPYLGLKYIIAVVGIVPPRP